MSRLFRVVFVLWAGSLWSTALWVAPTLFYLQSDRHLAGVLATRLFSIETYLGLGVAAASLLVPARSRFRLGYGAVALLAVNEWLLKRVMTLAQSHGSVAGLTFGAWHGVSALVYGAACLVVVVLVWNEDFR